MHHAFPHSMPPRDGCQCCNFCFSDRFAPGHCPLHESSVLTGVTAHFRSLLPLDYDWVFIDGPAECDAAPGIAAFFPPPYRCWYTTPTTARIESAQQKLFSFIKREGPFDAVMGFSQVSQSISALFQGLKGYHRVQHWQPR